MNRDDMLQKRQESQRIWERTLKEIISANIRGFGKYIKTIPARHQKRWWLSVNGENGKADALKAKCLDCSGYDINEIKLCNVRTCPLHPYRPYQKGENK